MPVVFTIYILFWGSIDMRWYDFQVKNLHETSHLALRLKRLIWAIPSSLSVLIGQLVENFWWSKLTPKQGLLAASLSFATSDTVSINCGERCMVHMKTRAKQYTPFVLLLLKNYLQSANGTNVNMQHRTYG